MIPDSVLNEIQNRLDIVEVISSLVPLKRVGRNFKANCPFHQEKTASFMVSAEKQIFHCFGCGAGGNVFGFLMKAEKKDFREVVETLAERVGIQLPKAAGWAENEKLQLLVRAHQLAMDFYHENLVCERDSGRALAYLKKRGIQRETLGNFKLGAASDSWDNLYRHLKSSFPERVLERAGLVIPKKDGDYYDRFRQRVLFPIVDARGVCVAFGGRVLDDSLPKYLNSPETEIYSKGRHLYGLYQARKAIRESESVIVVEGYMDLIACHQAGVLNVVASLGTALTADQARLVKRNAKNVFILYDADKAGEMATLRGLELFLEEGLEVRVVRLSKGHDPDSFLREHGVGRLGEALAGAKTLFEFKLSVLREKFDARSAEGKARIADEMLGLFLKTPNEVLRSAWVKDLARELGVPDEALLKEMHKKDRRPSVKPETPTAAVSQHGIRPAEKLLVGLLLDNPDFVSRAKEEISAQDILNPNLRNVVQKLLEEGAAPAKPARMINFYKDDPESTRLISLACAEVETVEDKAKSFHDCLVWLKKSRFSAQREGIRSQILTAQQAGDRNRISQLLYDLHKLNKGMKSINEKK